MACDQPSGYNYYSSGGTIGTFGTAQVKDPVQGRYLQNCSLIAAFASLAWRGRITAQAADPRTTTYIFQFYNPNRQVRLDGRTPLDATGKLMHAKSDTPTEIWPALYEKAYYMWLDNITDPSGRPDYCRHATWQSPVTVLNQLTGMNTLQKDCQRDFTNSDTVFSFVDTLCANCTPAATNRKLNYPAVAWTFDPAVRNPYNVTFSATKIAAKHCYSLLGVTGTKSGATWTSKYIVLRNPYGSGKGDPTGLTLFNGTWCTFNLATSDGLFALAVDEFVKYFEGFTWVV